MGAMSDASKSASEADGEKPNDGLRVKTIVAKPWINHGITVLVDTSVTHIMAQAKDHTSQPEPRQGKAAPTGDPIATRDRKKNGKYKDAARAVNKEFIPLVMDTYGRMGKPFLNFILFDITLGLLIFLSNNSSRKPGQISTS